MAKTKVVSGKEDKIVKISGEEVVIKPNEYYTLADNSEKCVIRNFKLNELAVKFNILVDDIIYDATDLKENNMFEYLCKVIVVVDGKKFIGIGESNERNLLNDIAKNFRGTMASVRGEGRAFVKALKYLGLEGDFYSEAEFEIQLFNEEGYKEGGQEGGTSTPTGSSNKEEYETAEQILAYKIDFGKCKDMTISMVREKNPWMFKWYIDALNDDAGRNPKVRKVGELITKLLELEKK